MHRYHLWTAVASVVFALVLANQAAAQHAEHQHDQSPPVPASGNASADSDSASATDHVAPEPPQHVMGEMSYQSMVSMMQMDDTVPMSRVLFDQLEWRRTSEGDVAVWDVQAWYGGDYNKAVIKTEGERTRDAEEAQVELLWDRIFARWWSVQAGMRGDFGEGPSRTWAVIGIEGLAPYWFDVEATLYIGGAGRSAVRLSADYDLLLTQRLIVSSEIEANWYGQSEPEQLRGSGVSAAEIALRLRYEIRREFAPYVGIAWQRKFAKTADYARAAGLDASDVQAVAGLRIWF